MEVAEKIRTACIDLIRQNPNIPIQDLLGPEKIVAITNEDVEVVTPLVKMWQKHFRQHGVGHPNRIRPEIQRHVDAIVDTLSKDYSDQIVTLSKEVYKLQKKLNASELTKEELKKELAETINYQEQIRSYLQTKEQEISHAKDVHHKLSQENMNLLTRVNDLQNDSKRTHESFVKGKQIQSVLNQDIDNLKNENISILHQLKDQELVNIDLKKLILNLKSELSQKDQNIQHLQTALRQETSRNDQLKNENRNLKQDIHNLKCNYDRLNQEKSFLIEEQAQLKKKLKNF